MILLQSGLSEWLARKGNFMQPMMSQVIPAPPRDRRRGAVVEKHITSSCRHYDRYTRKRVVCRLFSSFEYKDNLVWPHKQGHGLAWRGIFIVHPLPRDR